MKKKIGIWMGYSEFFNSENYKTKKMGGSELSALRFIEEFKNDYDIYVFGNSNKKEDIKKIDGVFWSIFSEFEKIIIEFDVLIIFRYINFFIHCSHRAKKTILWLEDMIINYYYNGTQLDSIGKHLTFNCRDKINKVVCLSKWHVSNMKLYYPFIEDSKYEIIENPINLEFYDKNKSLIKNKIKNKFIYVSDLTRGFSLLLDCLIKLQDKIPDLSLVFFRCSELNEEMNQKLKKIKNVTAYGYVSNVMVQNEFMTSEYFFYPAIFQETFCCSAVEAQLYECSCIYNNIGCLNETINNRGLQINILPTEKDYIEQTVEKIYEFSKDSDTKQKLIDEGKKYALQTTMSNLRNKWLKILK